MDALLPIWKHIESGFVFRSTHLHFTFAFTRARLNISLFSNQKLFNQSNSLLKTMVDRNMNVCQKTGSGWRMISSNQGKIEKDARQDG